MTTASVSFPALGTKVVLCTEDEEALARARRVLERELVAIDLACSRFRPDSELMRLNGAAGRRVQVGELLIDAVEVALDAAETTAGLVTPTVGAALRLAGYDRTFNDVRRRPFAEFRPTFTTIAGWRLVELDRERRTIRLPRGVELDLGATAKALAADRAAAAASEASGSPVLVGLGGDIAVAGGAPEGGWPIQIADDHAADPAGPGPVVTVAAGGLATSSTTVRHWRTAGGHFHHILDPRTGRPAESLWRTVSVAAGSCVDANVASTAAIVLGEAAPAWLAERRLASRLVRRGGEVVTIAGWPEDTP